MRSLFSNGQKTSDISVAQSSRFMQRMRTFGTALLASTLMLTSVYGVDAQTPGGKAPTTQTQTPKKTKTVKKTIKVNKAKVTPNAGPSTSYGPASIEYEQTVPVKNKSKNRSKKRKTKAQPAAVGPNIDSLNAALAQSRKTADSLSALRTSDSLRLHQIDSIAAAEQALRSADSLAQIKREADSLSALRTADSLAARNALLTPPGGLDTVPVKDTVTVQGMDPHRRLMDNRVEVDGRLFARRPTADGSNPQVQAIRNSFTSPQASAIYYDSIAARRAFEAGDGSFMTQVKSPTLFAQVISYKDSATFTPFTYSSSVSTPAILGSGTVRFIDGPHELGFSVGGFTLKQEDHGIVSACTEQARQYYRPGLFGGMEYAYNGHIGSQPFVISSEAKAYTALKVDAPLNAYDLLSGTFSFSALTEFGGVDQFHLTAGKGLAPELSATVSGGYKGSRAVAYVYRLNDEPGVMVGLTTDLFVSEFVRVFNLDRYFHPRLTALFGRNDSHVLQASVTSTLGPVAVSFKYSHNQNNDVTGSVHEMTHYPVVSLNVAFSP